MTGKRSSVTKTEAVRQALHHLGPDASRTALQSFIKKKFGHEMSDHHIYNYKSALKQKQRAGAAKAITLAPAAKKPAAAAPKAVSGKPHIQRTATRVVHVSARANSSGAAKGISVPDIQVVKDLLGRVGAHELKALVDVLKA